MSSKLALKSRFTTGPFLQIYGEIPWQSFAANPCPAKRVRIVPGISRLFYTLPYRIPTEILLPRKVVTTPLQFFLRILKADVYISIERHANVRMTHDVLKRLVAHSAYCHVRAERMSANVRCDLRHHSHTLIKFFAILFTRRGPTYPISFGMLFSGSISMSTSFFRLFTILSI